MAMSVRVSSRSEKLNGANGGNDIQDRIAYIGCIISYIICGIFFIINTYAIFIEFHNQTTIISTNVMRSQDRLLELPTLLICNESAFKEPILHTTYSGYKNNTLSLDDVLVDMLFVKDIRKSILNAKPISMKASVKEVVTTFRGTCFITDEKLQMKPEDTLWLELNAKFNLKLYAINPGDEVFAPMFVWPNYPPEQKLDRMLAWTQIWLTKETKLRKGDECNNTHGYVFGDCIREQFKHFYEVEQSELFSRCNIPWTINLTGRSIDDPSLPIPCNISDATVQSLNLADFFYKATAYSIPGCKVPCYTSTYKMQTNQFERSSIISQYMVDAYKTLINVTRPHNIETYSTMISFLKTDVDVSEEIQLHNVPNFISSVGGNLGLFIGFSFLSVLLRFFEFTRKLQLNNLVRTSRNK